MFFFLTKGNKRYIFKCEYINKTFVWRNFSIPDPGSNSHRITYMDFVLKAPDPGSGSATLVVTLIEPGE